MRLPDLTQSDLSLFEAELCARSLADFIRQAWPILDPGQPYIHGWHIDAICEHLEAVSRGEITRLLINVPPGMSKSKAAAVYWPAWLWGPAGAPHKRFIGASHEQGLAIRDARYMRNLVRSEWYQAKWPIELVGDQNAKTYFENTASGFRQATAVKSMTGRRGDVVLWDDPLNPEQAYSDAEATTATRVFRETLPTRLNDPVESAIVVIAQRLAEADVPGHILASDYGYVHLCLPMEYDPKRRCVTVIGFEDPRTEEGELLAPERFPRETVDRDRKILGEFAFAAQYQQQPVPREGGDFDVSQIQIVDALPAGLDFIRGWDLAATVKKTSDYTASVRLAVDTAGVTWIAHAEKFRGRPDQVDARILQRAKTDVLTEQSIPTDPGQAGVAQKAALSKLLTGHRFHFSAETGDKRARAGPIASQVNVGNVRVLRGTWNDEFLEDIRLFPMGAHDDVVDAMSRAYNRAAQQTPVGLLIPKRLVSVPLVS